MPDAVGKDARAKELGAWLTEWRRKRGLSRPETVAQALKHDPRASLSADYLAKLEYGVRSLASAAADNREALRLALNIGRETWEVETGLLVPARHAGDHAAEPSPPNPKATPALAIQLSDTLRAFIDEYSAKFKELLEPRWQRWLANTDFRDEPETPEDWLAVFLYFREKVNPR